MDGGVHVVYRAVQGSLLWPYHDSFFHVKHRNGFGCLWWLYYHSNTHYCWL